jgi:hypothetical protein
MWLSDDIKLIEDRIRNIHKLEDLGEIPQSNRIATNVAVDIIRNSWLRCDIIKFMFHLINKGW